MLLLRGLTLYFVLGRFPKPFKFRIQNDNQNLTINSQKTMYRQSQKTSVHPRTAVGSFRGFVRLSVQPIFPAHTQYALFQILLIYRQFLLSSKQPVKWRSPQEPLARNNIGITFSNYGNMHLFGSSWVWSQLKSKQYMKSLSNAQHSINNEKSRIKQEAKQAPKPSTNSCCLYIGAGQGAEGRWVGIVYV